MKALTLVLLLHGAATGQVAVPLNALPAELVRFHEAAAPLESWLGKKLVIFDQASQDPLESPLINICPATRNPSEAIITPLAVYVSLAQLRNFTSASALADFLSHAAAHNKLNTSAQFYSSVRVLSPHIPDKYAEQIDRNRCRSSEDAVAPVTAEFRASSNCTPESCEAFERLLAAAKQ